MKVFVVLLSAIAVASALHVDFDSVFPRHIDPKILAWRKAGPSGRITGGTEAVPNSLPYQAALFIEVPGGTAFCGGSLISPTIVLTAAHCVVGAFGVEVLLGAHNVREEVESERKAVFAEKIIIHEKWDASRIRNDIALIVIPKVTLSKSIQPIALPRRSQMKNDFSGSAALASGWGKPADSATGISPVLRQIDTKIISKLSCSLGLLFLTTDDNICIDGKNGKSTCNGDSGGPLVLKINGVDTLVGATSFGLASGCEKGNPGAFARITSFMDWISLNSGIPILE